MIPLGAWLYLTEIRSPLIETYVIARFETRQLRQNGSDHNLSHV